MTVFNSLSGFYVKQRPKPHRLEGVTTKQHGGFTLSRMPRKYPLTSRQRMVREAAHSCGIHAGITRSALVTAMRTCIPGKLSGGGVGY